MFATGPQDINVTSFEGVITLYCEGTGFPIPDITWYQNGTVIDASEDEYVTITTTSESSTRTVNSTLVITRAVMSNSGDYHCNLSSSVSEYEEVMSRVARVFVQGKSY